MADLEDKLFDLMDWVSDEIEWRHAKIKSGRNRLKKHILEKLKAEKYMLEVIADKLQKITVED